MQEFTYTIQDPQGVHARPAGELAKLAKRYSDTIISVLKGDQGVKATQLLKLMSLGIRAGDQVTVRAEGPSEQAAIAALKDFFQERM